MQRAIILVFFCLLTFQHLQSQVLMGSLKDYAGKGIEYANINKKNTTIHSHSDALGRFNLSDINIGDTIEITHIYYNALVFIVDASDINVEKVYELKDKKIVLEEITISPQKSGLVTINDIDVEINPVQNAQELLRRVPGLVIGQHAGGGKAEQIFLRGFDIDHGTDINLSIDGLPINMVSHAHGQGYADMHFIMPEILGNISYGKGPYDAAVGNFATAGSVQFSTLDRPQHSFVKTEVGNFNTKRLATLLKIVDTDKDAAYIAGEYTTTDGPFEATQAFNRLNLFAKYTKSIANNSRFSIWASTFSSRWDASGQIPVRAVESGLINRFGAIDDTEGGQTSRTNVVAKLTTALDNNMFVTSRAYASKYDFLLFSNFTFFLNDPLNGDQIKQQEARSIFGFDSELNILKTYGEWDVKYRVGAGLRYDNVDNVELSNTVNRRTTLSTLALGNVDETNYFTYADATFSVGKWQMNAGIRADQINYIYQNGLTPTYELQEAQKSSINPKLNVQYTFNKDLQLFAKFGRGFHSNDTRVVIDNSAEQILPGAYGADFGAVFKPFSSLIINAAAWYLFLDQEFVYVGDGGIVEPSGRTRRQGIDVGIRVQPLPWLFIYSDLNLAKPRSVDDPEGSNLIALAPTLVNTGGLTIQNNKWKGGINYRHIGDRTANEDNSIVATGYTVADANIQYQIKSISLGVQVYNIFNTEWNETQFATESRLQTEAEPVEEIHFTPGAPFQIRGILTYQF